MKRRTTSKAERRLIWLGSAFTVLLVLFAFFRLENDGAALVAADLNGVTLSTLDGAKAVDLGKCKTEKCLTVYVSPWCGICRKSTPFINELKGYFIRKNIDTRIVVGRGQADQVREYASAFGPDVLLDMSAAYPLQGGVPNFAVSNSKGEVVKVVPGVPGIWTPPFPEALMVKMGDYLGLF
jgi:hypothetical protein